MSIRFITFGKFTEEPLLVSHSAEPKYSEGFQKEASNIIKKLASLNLRSDERQKIKTANGAWFCKAIDNQTTCVVLCTEDYPERHAYRLVQDAQIELEKIPNYQSADQPSLIKSMRKPLEQLARKYSDIKSLDKLYAANENVNQVTSIMSKNLDAQMASMAKLEETEKKSALLKDSSAMFYDNSVELRKIQAKRLLRLKIIVGVMVIVVGIIIWRIVVAVKD